MKILCVCERGNSRSVALAWILKDHLHHDAIAIGAQTASDETKAMLYGWADLIIAVTHRALDGMPPDLSYKTMLCDVGADRFFRGFDIGLLNFYARFLEANGLTTDLAYLVGPQGQINIHWPTRELVVAS